jgi:hypothetical protein
MFSDTLIQETAQQNEKHQVQFVVQSRSLYGHDIATAFVRSQLPKRCCHYRRDEANYRSAVATIVVMKPTTEALLPLPS